MTEFSCDNPEEHCDLHACQLQFKESKPEVEEMFRDPKFVCTNCGAKVHDAANVCLPKPL